MNKILFVYHASNIGGGTYCLLNILKEIDRDKYQPIVLLKSSGDLVKEISLLKIDVYYMNSMALVPYNRSLYERGVINTYLKIKKSLHHFSGLLDAIKPDAVYFNTMMLAPYLEVAKKKGCKTAIHLREHWPLNENKLQLSKIQSAITNYADQIVAINNYSASMVPERNVTIVYDWIDMSKRFKYRPYDDIFKEDTSKLKVYLFTGGLQDIKGAAEVVNVFTKHITDINKRLLLVGVNPHPQYLGVKNIIRYLLSKIGICVYEFKVRKMIAKDDRIVCIPATYEIAHVLKQAYCNLSFFTIPHANLTLAESIIMGTVSVAAKTDESIEYSKGGELALLFELGNQNDLIAKLKELDSNYDSIKTKISKGCHEVEHMFDKKRNVMVLNGILENLFKK